MDLSVEFVKRGLWWIKLLLTVYLWLSFRPTRGVEWMEERKDECIEPHLFRYGAFTPAMFGMSHLMYRKHVPTSPNTETIKHILAEPVRFNFRRLLMYAPATKRTVQL